MKLLARLIRPVQYMKRQTVYTEGKTDACIKQRLEGITNCWEEQTVVDHREDGMIKNVQMDHFEENQCQ